MEHVKRLTQQFTMIDAITRELLDSHVTELSQVQRQNFEGTSSNEAVPTTGRGRRSAPAAAAASAQQLDGVANSRYSGEDFIFTFKADEKALLELLNRLAKMPMFVVVHDLSVKREKPGLQLLPEKAASETDKTKTTPALTTQRMASGPEISPLLEIKMHMDVYTFEGV